MPKDRTSRKQTEQRTLAENHDRKKVYGPCKKWQQLRRTIKMSRGYSGRKLEESKPT